jgi:hypothetical protein
MTKHQKKQLDILWQQKVTEGKPCSYPGCCKMGSEGHHAVMKRRYLNTRWDVKNGRALCNEHHIYAETNPKAYENLIVGEIGAIEYARIRDKALMVRKQFYDEIRRELI